MKRFSLSVAAVLAALFLSACSTASSQNTYTTRVELLALLETLNADILAAPSATATLERWCRDHAMAADPKIVAIRDTNAQKTPSAEQLQRLGVTSASEVRYRHVRLQCGAHTFSVADNWYVPARLTPEMNRALETTDSPFGKVVRELAPYRRTIAVTLLWAPLARGWELRPRPRSHQRVAIPQELMVHTAVLYTAGHQPFSEVVETYQRDLLAFRGW
ncbi:MAG: hypothetical protein M3Q69_18455 [Acidobacteriota bacterium]|nr:hypothetical protein [Acidobacteriota bacterium]